MSDVPVRAQIAARAGPAREKRAQMRPIPAIIRRPPARQLLQQRVARRVLRKSAAVRLHLRVQLPQRVRTIDVAIGEGHALAGLEEGVANLDREPVLEVEDAGLANVLGLGAGAADFSLLVARVGAGEPAEDGERNVADLCSGSPDSPRSAPPHKGGAKEVERRKVSGVKCWRSDTKR